ncbi:MAG: response regulator transcription factor [Oscillospiraceae bacterium]|jgi:two-component system response regulator VicR|nr:response regulator transcription factor [Oscillospiraceae bacterium]
MACTILIVDDEKSIVDILKFNLNREGYDTAEAYDGEEALQKYGETRPDLILLDVMLPRTDGFEVCRRIRERDKLTPIIMLTAREEESDKVLGLDIGADDYVTKPFKNMELMARVKANIRRTSAAAPPAAPGAPGAGLFIDFDRFDAFVGGRAAELTAREFDLLAFLAASPGRVFSREELLREVWRFEYFGDDLRAVDVAIRRLREKIEEDGANPKHILTRRGAGYYFEG